MKKKLLVFLNIVWIFAFATNIALAVQPEQDDADGTWCSTSIDVQPISFEEYAGSPDKSFLKESSNSSWTGFFSGASMDYGLIGAHVSAQDSSLIPMTFVRTSSFAEVEVDGKVGGLEMDLFGYRPDPTADWIGTWVITGGTGELEDFQATGAFWGPGGSGDTEDCGEIYYSVDDTIFGDVQKLERAEVAFDGENCKYEGPGAIYEGEVVFNLNDESEAATQLYIFKLDEGKDWQSVLDYYGDSGTSHGVADWMSDVKKKIIITEPSAGKFTLAPGLYTIQVFASIGTSGIVFPCSSLDVQASP